MVQVARPVSDGTTNGVWTDKLGSPLLLFGNIDEEVADDTDYVMSPNSPTDAESYSCGLGTVDDPEVSTDHVVRYRVGKRLAGADTWAAGGDIIDVVVRLRQGDNGTVIAEWEHLGIGLQNALHAFEQTLTTDQANTITNYATLFVEFDPFYTEAGSGSRKLGVSWFEMEVPDAGAAPPAGRHRISSGRQGIW